MKSRRRFLELVALSSVAALAPVVTPRRSRAAPARRSRRPAAGATPTRSAAIEAEVRRQVKSTAAVLKTVRDYELPTGSEMAFAFAPLRAAKRRRTPPARPAASRESR